MGIRLLQRSRSGVQLTAEGQLLLPHIKAVINSQRQLDEHINEINGLREGLIRIGTFNSASAQWLPGIIHRFHVDYPGVRFELLHGTNEQIETWINDGQIDVGFVKYPTNLDLDAYFLYRDPIVSIFSQNDPHTAQECFQISQLPSLSYIALNEGVEDEITAILDQNKIHLNAQFMESDDHAVIAMVEAGLGTSLMSMMMLQGFSHRITAIPLDPPVYRDLGVACRDCGMLSKAAATFMEYAKSWVSEWKQRNQE